VKKIFSGLLLLVCIIVISSILSAAGEPEAWQQTLNNSYTVTVAHDQFKQNLPNHFATLPNKNDLIVGSLKFDAVKDSKVDLPYSVSGQGAIQISGVKYPFQLQGDIDGSLSDNGKRFFHGFVDGNINTKKGDKITAVFLILSIPSENKLFVTVGLDQMDGQPVGLAFGEKFSEVEVWSKKKFGGGTK
jgi:hypothetical protein